MNRLLKGILVVSLFTITVNCKAMMTTETTGVKKFVVSGYVETPIKEHWIYFGGDKDNGFNQNFSNVGSSITVANDGTVTELNLSPALKEAFVKGMSGGIVAKTPSGEFVQIPRNIILEMVPELKKLANAINCKALLTTGVNKFVVSDQVDKPLKYEHWIYLEKDNTFYNTHDSLNEGTVINVANDGTVTELYLTQALKKAFVKGTSGVLVARTPSGKFVKISRNAILEMVPELKELAKQKGRL